MKAFPKDVTVQTMTTRHIGVESELGVTGLIGTIERVISQRGLLQSIGHDGGGREFRTNPISIRSLKQVRGYKYLSEYYGELSKSTEVLDTGGTHIHISILNTDHPNMEANAAALATAFHEQFQKVSGRITHWAGRMRPSYLADLKEYLSERKSITGRTYSLKGYMLNPTYHQTLEFRGPRGSNDSKEILAWVEFLDNVVKVANRESIEGVQFKRLLRGKRISAYIDSLKGWRKLTDADLEKKLNGAALR